MDDFTIELMEEGSFEDYITRDIKLTQVEVSMTKMRLPFQRQNGDMIENDQCNHLMLHSTFAVDWKDVYGETVPFHCMARVWSTSVRSGYGGPNRPGV